MALASQTRERRATLLRAVLAGLCIVLVLLVGAAHLLHSHPQDAPSDAGCSLCVVAHLSASPAPEVAGPVVTRVLQPLTPPDPVLALPASVLLSFYIRPPPVSIPHA